jgi:cobaltochelatase CobS
MVAVAGMTRVGFAAGDLSTVMSPRTVISWAENVEIFGDIVEAFELAFGNTCDPAERPILAEYLQRAMGLALPELT